jgi:hypothetical protein
VVISTSYPIPVMVRIQGNFKGVNSFCNTCKKACKQFQNVKIVICPNYEHISVKT